jgi:hypothetical protein
VGRGLFGQPVRHAKDVPGEDPAHGLAAQIEAALPLDPVEFVRGRSGQNGIDDGQGLLGRARSRCGIERGRHVVSLARTADIGSSKLLTSTPKPSRRTSRAAAMLAAG